MVTTPDDTNAMRCNNPTKLVSEDIIMNTSCCHVMSSLSEIKWSTAMNNENETGVSRSFSTNARFAKDL